MLAQYYSIPWLSYRDAVWHEYMADVPGFSRYEIFPMEEERHPTPLGHRWASSWPAGRTYNMHSAAAASTRQHLLCGW